MGRFAGTLVRGETMIRALPTMRARPAATTPQRLAVLGLGLAAGLGVAAIIVTSDHADSPAATAAIALFLGWSFLASGLLAWQRRPESRVGPLMLVVAFLWFGGALRWADDNPLFSIGLLLDGPWALTLAYLTLGFPDGRIETRAGRVLMAAAVVLLAIVQPAWLAFTDSNAVICGSGCPANAVEVVRSDELANALRVTFRAGAAAICFGTTALLLLRWRAATPASRRAASPVFLVGGLAFAAVGFSVANDAAGDPAGSAPYLIGVACVAVVPWAFLVGVLRTRLARGAVAELVVQLGALPEPGALRDALARALADPALDVAYWLPGQQRFVDREGGPFALPGPAAARVTTLVERDGRRIAALVHDRALLDQPELVRSASAAAGLALENERLQAELRSRLGDLRRSRARIVAAGDAERRRVERDLHDGTQQRLVSVAMELGLAEAQLADDDSARALVRAARESLSAALAELREITQGIHPAVLSERGLGAALAELADRSPLPVELDVALAERPPAAVEGAAYFLVSEALANVIKHAQATSVSVAVHLDAGGALLVTVEDDGRGGAAAAGGSGLRGLADRVEALGGELTVVSPQGRGTMLRGRIPCAS